MRNKKILSVIMTIFMMLSLIPSMVFAAAVPSGTLDGKLKVKGLAAVGTTLSADYEKVLPEGMTDDYVSFKWSRKNGEELTEVGTEKTYKITDADLGAEIVLKITGMEDKGVSGSLTATTKQIVATEEEASQKVETEEQTPEEQTPEEQTPEEQTPEEQIPQDTEEPDIPEGNEEVFEPEEPVYDASISPENDLGMLDFGTLAYGYSELPSEQYVTIQNTGNATLNFDSISPEHFMVQDVENTLNPGECVTLWVVPREGLEPGSYEDTITYTTAEGVSVSVVAKVVVEEAATPEETPTPEPTETPEETPTPEPTETPVPEYKVQVAPEVVDFGTVTEGYTEVPASQTVTITNQGNVKIILMDPESQNFVLSALTAIELEPGETTSFTVAPKEALPEGEYIEAIYFYPMVDGEGGEALSSVTAKMKVEKAKVYKLTVEPENIDFGRREEGYESVPEAQNVKVTNTGNASIHLEQPSGSNFDIGALSAAELAPGESCNFTIAPKKGLGENQYLEEIAIGNKENAKASLTASFMVSKKTVKLKSIQKPADIKGLANGSEKSAAGLKLPATVEVDTTSGKMKANVKWDVKGCAYNPAVSDAQTFEVKGTVSLPKGIENPNEIALSTTVKVTVNGRSVVVPDASQNKITGVDPNGKYTTETKITFEAVGAGMNNTSPQKGDIRYLPVKWNVLEDRKWESSPYTATFRMGQGGNYTLKVTFDQQKYDNGKWNNTGAADVKQVNFSVAHTKNPTVTPAKQKGNQKKPVLTGDNTAIVPFVIILAIAAICIVVVVVYRKKKR